MADFEHARAMLRMAHKDFNALTGMQDNGLFADEIWVSCSTGGRKGIEGLALCLWY